MPHEQRNGATHARAATPPRLPSLYELGLMILDDECPPDGMYYMCRMGCAGELDDVCARLLAAVHAARRQRGTV